MSRAFICDHCERLYVSWRGFVDLLDMDNIQCRKDDKLIVVPIEHCNGCEEATWEHQGSSASEWDYYMNKEIYVNGETRTEYEYYDSGEQESYLP
jgi:hypothetical protein